MQKKSEPEEPAILIAEPADAPELLALQKRAFQSEALRYNNFTIAPLRQSLDELRNDFSGYRFLKAVRDGTIVGSVKTRLVDEKCWVGRLMVEPTRQGHGIGTRLLRAVEDVMPQASEYFLFTGIDSSDNIAFYERNGYSRSGESIEDNGITLVGMRKPRV